MKALPETLTIDEVCIHFGVTGGAVSKWVHAGLIPVIRVNKKTYLFDKRVIDLFVPPHINGAGRRPGPLRKRKKKAPR